MALTIATGGTAKTEILQLRRWLAGKGDPTMGEVHVVWQVISRALHRAGRVDPYLTIRIDYALTRIDLNHTADRLGLHPDVLAEIRQAVAPLAEQMFQNAA
ncbi:hypothetical protein [Bradyrhizobium tropiciagri]|uniref:hypothetical protein n=1 Tax=Bradyrhizobium tropiciagri TaxID=312253 RepID=UPI00067C6744|nr:hypothetical protein [Bradyrhizobium tropiciagri]